MAKTNPIEDLMQAELFISSSQLSMKRAWELLHGRSEMFKEAIKYALDCLEMVRKSPKKVDNFKVVWAIDKIKGILNIDQPPREED